MSRRAASTRTQPDAEQQQPVDDRREDLQAVGAVGVLGGLRTAAELDGGQRQAEPQHVGGHVGGVREQRQAARHQTADHLHQHVAAGQEQRDGQRTHMGGGGGPRSGTVVVTGCAVRVLRHEWPAWLLDVDPRSRGREARLRGSLAY